MSMYYLPQFVYMMLNSRMTEVELASTASSPRLWNIYFSPDLAIFNPYIKITFMCFFQALLLLSARSGRQRWRKLLEMVGWML